MARYLYKDEVLTEEQLRVEWKKVNSDPDMLAHAMWPFRAFKVLHLIEDGPDVPDVPDPLVDGL